MLPLGTINGLTGHVRAIGAQRPAEKRQILEAVAETLGIALAPVTPAAAAGATDAVLSVEDAAARLAVSPRTLRWYCRIGDINGVRRGRTARLSGVPASEVDAFIARTTTAAAPAATGKEPAR